MRQSGCTRQSVRRTSEERYALPDAMRLHWLQFVVTGIGGNRLTRKLLTATNLLEVIPYDCVPIAVELNDKAKSLHKYTHPERAFYIFGPEDGSIPPEIQQRCRDWIQIPTKYCMNLAATVNVVLYDRLSKLHKLAGTDV